MSYKGRRRKCGGEREEVGMSYKGRRKCGGEGGGGDELQREKKGSVVERGRRWG